MESSEIDPHIYDNLVFNKGKVIEWGKDSLLKNGAPTVGYTYEKKRAWTLTSYQTSKLDLNIHLNLKSDNFKYWRGCELNSHTLLQEM